MDDWPGSENLGFGTALTALAVAVNGTLGAYLIRAGRRRDSLILIANGKHVLTIAGRAWGVGTAVVLTMCYRLPSGRLNLWHVDDPKQPFVWLWPRAAKRGRSSR